MAITTLAAHWYGSGNTSTPSIPTVTGEILASSGLSGSSAQDLEGFFALTLDGSATTAAVVWIDGTQALYLPPCGAVAFRIDPPAYTASTYYPLGAVVLGSGHVQQATVAGYSAATPTPTWKTDGTSVVDNQVTWTDEGAIALSTLTPVSFTAITKTGATLTISGAGTSTQVMCVSFKLILRA